MQKATAEYKKSMNEPLRNRGYIKAVIGVINSKAQENVSALNEKDNHFTYYSDIYKPFHYYKVEKVYATLEQDFSHVDGTMYFLPEQEEEMEYYNNGLVTENLVGEVHINFSGETGFYIKGLTINFGEYYPTELIIEHDKGQNHYFNDQSTFITEDTFDGVSYFIIKPIKMVNGKGRMRIFEFYCGINNVFTNDNVLSCNIKDYVSSITETVPSQDVTLTVDNQSLYYSVDNPKSALYYMETGQEVKIAFGYDVDGNGNIEWMPEVTTFLKTWSADDVQAKFTATDRFDYFSGTFYKGRYRKEGISLYDLALEVLTDAGITDEREYFIDPYLKDVIVYNPLPAVKHSEALQIIANAGRCALYEDRQNRIHLRASFVPVMTASVNGQTDYSHIDKLLKGTKKEAYAIYSNDFSVTDETIRFMPENPKDYLENTGYVSSMLADNDGNFETQPVITVTLEAGFVAYGMLIRFRNVAPQRFTIQTYYQEVEVQTIDVENPELEYITYDEFDLFDKMTIMFTKGHPRARITIDSILINDVTDYVLDWKTDLNATPVGTRQERIKAISVTRTLYESSTEELSDLISEELEIPYDGYEYEVHFTEPSYGLEAHVVENEKVSCEIIEQSNYRAKLRFSGIETENQVVSYAISGYEYRVRELLYSKTHAESGAEKTWSNPLVSTEKHAKDMEAWLASYYLGMVDYSYTWRGDPRVDANDLFYLNLKERERVLVRSYEHNLKFNKAWSCTTKARRAVLSWQ